jgi:NAD(P)-dependent dehydrogenase (short-subunit alcohol dehydrogenase family)
MNKAAVVTGGSRGLGRAAAIGLAQKGVDVVVTFVNQTKEAEDVVNQVQQLGRRAAALRLDVGDTSTFGRFAEQLRLELAKWERSNFEYLLNNAGHGAYASFAETSEAQFDQLVDVHLKGPYFLTQKLLPLIADGGSILNVSSGLTRFAYAGYSAYASVKGAVEVLTHYQALELGKRGIRVNTLAPGAIETDFGGGAVRDNADLNAMIAGQTALGRVGKPDDVGSVVGVLLSDDMRWVNGQRVEVTGGIHL